MDAITKNVIVRAVNAIETGNALGDYAKISIYRDGKGRTRQITYGRSQTTEQGKLKDLLMLYVKYQGLYAAEISLYIEYFGTKSLVDDEYFKSILVRAGKEDPIMLKAQDDFFDKAYFEPAMDWAKKNGFTLPLSKLVIYDSFVQSGSILWKIRRQFDEKPPKIGGNEKVWIKEYLEARLLFLQNHKLDAVQRSVYRVKSFLFEIDDNNWNLDKTFVVNGILIK